MVDALDSGGPVRGARRRRKPRSVGRASGPRRNSRDPFAEREVLGEPLSQAGAGGFGGQLAAGGFAEPGIGEFGGQAGVDGFGDQEGAGGFGGQADSVAAEEAARLICLRLLTRSPRTRAQLADALRRRKVPAEAAEAVLGRFAEVGLIDDAAFARAWVESRHHGRGLARRALAAELRQRGVASEEVRAAVRSLGPAEEKATAERLVARRIAGTRDRPLPARVRYLVGVLARKGYPAGLAYRVVKEALEQEGVDTVAAGLDLDAMGEDEALGSDEIESFPGPADADTFPGPGEGDTFADRDESEALTGRWED